MAATDEALWEKLWASQRLPRGKGQITALESVLRTADAEGSPELRYAARIFVISAYQQGGEPAKAFVPFSWCLAVYDRGEADPRWDDHLYWAFKFLVSSMTRFPEMPLDRTYAVLDDMERRYRVAGHTMNPVHQHRELVARHVGEHETAAEQYRLWTASPRGEMSDCVGCEPSAKVWHLSRYGRFEEAIAIAEPVLGGVFTCVEQPHTVLTSLLLPYVHTGRMAEAARAHRQAYRAIRHDRTQLGDVSDHLEFCALTGNHARGLELLERHLGWLAEAPSPYTEMEFSATAALTLRRVAESGHGDAKVKRPGGEISVKALHAELSERALAIATRFDARNGTSEQGDRIRSVLAAEPLVEHLPLSGPVSRPAATSEPVLAEPSYPDTPAALADLAEERYLLDDDIAAAAAWARFDEVCPEPTGELLARRIAGAAAAIVGEDVEAAERDWTRAAELFAEAGDEIARHAASSKAALARCRSGDSDSGLSTLGTAVSALATLGDQDQYVRALLRLSLGQLASGDADAALDVLGRAEDAVAASGSAELTGRILLQRADLVARSGPENLGAARELAERGAAVFTEARSPNHAARATIAAARMSAALGELDYAYTAAANAEAATDPELRAQARFTLGRLALDLDRPADAVQHYRDAVADLTAAGDSTGAAHARVELAAASDRLDRPEEVADAAEDAIDVLERVGDESELARARYLLAGAYRALGQREQACALLEPVIEHFDAAEHPPAAGQAAETAADILDELDHDAEAAEHYVRAAEYFRTAELPLDSVRNLRCATLSWLWAGEPDKALEALAAAEKCADTLDGDEPIVRWERAMVGYNGARLLANCGRPDDALERVATAAELLRGVGATTEAAFADALRGRLLTDLGRTAEAREAVEAALAGLPPDADRQREGLEALLAELTGQGSSPA
ncbi:tetratricopeptide repeat protein [Amycolatopsis sp. NPDC058986]|uniref:tetratricopeptide repeat protein n=1 Tax=unclassified Amycolatopsis TaxID=2618356 RepID=UPI00366F8DC0